MSGFLAPLKKTTLSALVTAAILADAGQVIASIEKPGTLTTLLDTASNTLPGNLGSVQIENNLPLPAGATLVDVSEDGQYVLFSSMDPNVVDPDSKVATQQETLPPSDNLYWMDLTKGTRQDQRVIRLVTHYAGSVYASPGFSGFGLGVAAPYQPRSADLSSDGQTVVFDSIINAHDYDASVPMQNDQPNAKESIDYFNQEPLVVGTSDVFVWSAKAADKANNIKLVSVLNSLGKSKAVADNPLPIDKNQKQEVPDPSKPMAAGIFNEFLPLKYEQLQEIQKNPAEAQEKYGTRPFEFQLLTANNGLSQDGTKIIYVSMVPAPWLDSYNQNIKDALPLSLKSPGYAEQTSDGFHVTLDPHSAGGAAGIEATAKTLTVTVNKVGDALGSFETQLNQPNGVFLLNELFEAEFVQMSNDGSRVAFSTRQNADNVIAGVADSDFSLDVFVFDIASKKNILVSRKNDDPKSAAGVAQKNFDANIYLNGGSYEFFDSMNHSLNNDGKRVAITSSAGNLVLNMVDNNVEPVERELLFPDSGVKVDLLQAHPYDIYVTEIDSAASDKTTTYLINTPDGVTNTNMLATLSGFSSLGNTVLFATIANNFYSPKFNDGHYPPEWATGTYNKNLLLGGFSQLWARDIDKKTTTLVSVSADGTVSGNRATLGSPVPPGSSDTLANISTNGRFVLFSSTANNLVKGVYDRGFKGGIFLRDLQSGKSTLMSTTATGNVPSAGTFLNSAISINGDASGTARVFMDGTNGIDMQTQYRTEEIQSLTSHIYTLDYPRLAPASATLNPALVSVSAQDYANSILEYRGSSRILKSSPGKLFDKSPEAARVAMGDVNADGTADYIYGAGINHAPEVIVIDGRTNSQIMRFDAFPDTNKNGVYVAAADVNRDGYADIITSIGNGANAQINIYTGRYGYLIANIPVIKAGTGGLRVAGGDIDDDGYADVIVGSGGGTQAGFIKAFSGKNIADQFKAPAPSYPAIYNIPVVSSTGVAAHGVYVAAADMDSDGKIEVITSADNLSEVAIYEGATGRKLRFHDYATEFAGAKGLRVAARPGRIILGSGPSSTANSVVKIFSSYDFKTRFDMFEPSYYKAKTGISPTRKGVYVG